LRVEGEAIQGDTRKAGLLRRGACHRAALRADGVTSNLPQRAFQHREGSVPGFTRRYGCKTLVWYELCDTMTDAIAPRKANQGRIAAGKAGTDRIKNPSWRDLFDELI
jgi:predicted GIY-YIG superfamily endonuclease